MAMTTSAATAVTARIRPISSAITPNTRSVLAAPTFFSQPWPMPFPNRPPLAMADMVRVCW